MSDFYSPGPDMDRAMDKTSFERKGNRVYGRLGWAFAIFLGSMLIVPNVVYIVVSMINPDLLTSAFFGMPLSYAGMYLVGLPLMLTSLGGIPNMPAPQPEAREKMSVGALLALYPVLYAIMGIFSLLTALVEQLMGTSATVTLDDIVAMSGPAWIPFVFGVVVAPVMEELVFRGLIYRKAMPYGKPAYILWSSIIFGLFHLNFGQSIYAAAMGVIFAVVMARTGSVVYGIILHVMINFTGGIGLGSIIVRTGSTTAMEIYSAYCVVLMCVGIVNGIVMLVRHRRGGKARAAELPAADEAEAEAVLPRRKAFLNAGTYVYCGICLLIILSSMVMSGMA